MPAAVFCAGWGWPGARTALLSRLRVEAAHHMPAEVLPAAQYNGSRPRRPVLCCLQAWHCCPVLRSAVRERLHQLVPAELLAAGARITCLWSTADLPMQCAASCEPRVDFAVTE